LGTVGEWGDNNQQPTTDNQQISTDNQQSGYSEWKASCFLFLWL
jgi:hypothetical protein